MKEFRKTNQDLFICEECNITFKSIIGLSRHVCFLHNLKEYYDKWVKDKNEGLCKICGKETFYRGWYRGYNKTCSEICENKQRKITYVEKYGVDSVFKSVEVRNKGKQTCKKRYNDENYNNRTKCNETFLLHYGSHPFRNEQIKKQIVNTNILKYGCEYPTQNSSVKEKSKQTNLKKYGVEKPNQNKDILEKAQKSALSVKQYKNTDIWYQGSYELDFLEKYYDEYPDIERGPTIKYELDGKNKVYYPDFYIPSLNLIIECKNSYHANIRKISIEAKEKATIDNGFNYIIIIDKDYSSFLE